MIIDAKKVLEAKASLDDAIKEFRKDTSGFVEKNEVDKARGDLYAHVILARIYAYGEQL